MKHAYPMKCRIRGDAGGGVTRVDVYDDIGGGGWFGGISSADFAGQMSGVSGAIEVHINSGGGDVFDGIAIGSVIRNHPGPVTTIADGLAASIASVIFQAGQERVIQPGAMIMIHDAFGCCQGNADEMAKTAQTLDEVSANLADIYAERSAAGDSATWRAAMKAETWYKAQEAVDAGLADTVGAGRAELPAGMDVAAWQLPSRIAAALRELPAAASGGDCKTCGGTGRLKHPRTGKAGRTCPSCGGSGNAPDDGDGGDNGDEATPDTPDAPADALTADAARAIAREEIARAAGKDMHGDHERTDPDGDGDCDACPEGDTDHDYWSKDGKQLKSLPGKPLPAGDGLDAEQLRALIREEIAAAGGGVDDSDWDASKAWHNGAESDDPAAFYGGICAGKKAGDKATQDAWALPYKYTPSSPPNAAGVENALSRLPQTDGLTNASEAKALLQRLMKRVNPDYEPDTSDSVGENHSRPDLESIRTALRGAHA